jgi:hypothetical protein
MSQIQDYSTTLTYRVSVTETETEEETTEATILSQLDGILSRSEIAEPADYKWGDSYGIRSARTSQPAHWLHLQRAVLTLRYREKSLFLEVLFITDRSATQEDVELLSYYFEYMSESGWGLNHEFDLPDHLFNRLTVFFEATPREVIARPLAKLAALERGRDAERAARWAGWDYDKFLTLTDEELEGICKDLPKGAAARTMAKAVLTHRKVERLAQEDPDAF